MLIHYFAQLACRIGVRWTDTNSTQVRAALRALVGDELESDTISPYKEVQAKLKAAQAELESVGELAC